jgi:preprotein translocase subunit SecE
MRFEIYKRSQGKYTRLCSAFAVAIIAGLGCFQLYNEMKASDYGLWIETFIPAGLFAVLALLVFWLVNNPRVADFMIAAESEMKKVSWSSRQQITDNTKVVIIVVIVMAVLLGVTDLVFRTFFTWLLG